SLDIICRSGNKKGLQTISWLELPTTLTYAPLQFAFNLTKNCDGAYVVLCAGPSAPSISR
ncbi:hypothetical protein WBG78_14500, partial [Chryseolinea sp. T2]|uniref:hypothetical protein n=1 Tax=Chryseolinea sp. T2 TaxID=3129255 RepID=UPI00307780E8